MYLSGDVRFYSLSRREPGQPMYVWLSRKIRPGFGAAFEHLQLSISPDPATDILNAGFSISQAGTVNLQILTMDGKPLPGRSVTKTLPAGSYIIPFEVQDLPAGSYLLVLTSGGVHESKVFLRK